MLNEVYTCTNLVLARAIIEAEVGMGAVIDVLQAQRPCEPHRTDTLKVVDEVQTGCTLQAQRWVTVVNVLLTELSGVAGPTLALVRVYLVYT